jgi:PAS domain S-box-containing protein
MWRILVIDDDEDDFFIVREMLKEAKWRKYDVHWAATYAAGRDALHSNHYNAVLVDYDLGPHNGIELIREAKEREYAAPLILFTGRGSYEVDVEAMQAGATLYLTKGEVNPLLLERGIRYAIDLKQKETELRLSKERLEQELAERRRAEEQLAFQASLLDNIHDAIIANDTAQRITAWNKAAEKLYGYTAEEALGKIHGDLLRSEMSYEQRASLLQQLQEKDEYALEVAQHTKNGRRIIVDGMTITRRDGNGKITCYVTDNRHITERKQSEAALREGETHFQALVSASSQVLYRMGPDWREMRQLQGGNFLANTEKPNSNWMAEYIHPDDQPFVQGVIDTAVRTGTVFELEHRVLRADGTIGWTASRAVPVRNAKGEITEWFGAASDITERKKMENELRQREELLEAFFANSPSILNIVDDELRYVKTGNLTPAFFGLDRQSIVGKAIKDLAPGFFEKIRPILKRVIETGQPERREVQFPVFGSEGIKTDWQASFFPIPLPEGKTGIGIIGVEITAQKKAEEALRESEQRYTALFHAKTNGIAHCRVITDEQGQPIDYEILQVNDAHEKITGIKRADIEGHRAREVFPGIENFSFDFIGNYGQVALHGGEQNFEVFFEATSQWLSIYIYRTEPGEFTAIVTDISPRKQAEALLRESNEALQENEALLEAFFANSPGILNIDDAEFRYIKTDPITPTYFGLDRQSIVGKAVGDLSLSKPLDR